MKLPNDIASVTIGYSHKQKASERTKITNSLDCVRVLREIWNSDNIEFAEDFYVLLLNNANHVLGSYHLASGGQTACIVDIKTVAQVAILGNAKSVILAHNHPSGNITPSSNDREITSRIKSALKMFDISVLDHIILTAESHYSFANEGDL